MAKSIAADPYHCFRFAPRIGFDGAALGVSKIAVKPGARWFASGEVTITAAVKPEFIEFAKRDQVGPLMVGVYHVTDEFGVDGTPSLWLVLTEVVPAAGQMEIADLDAASSDVFTVSLTMKYDRLSFIFGDNPLDKLAAVT